MQSMSMITYQYRIKDSPHRKYRIRLSYAVNYVWNYCNEVSMLALRRDGKWLSAYDLHKLTAGCAAELGLHAHTIQRIGTEYVKQRQQFRKRRLSWRSRKRHLGWIPFKVNGIKLIGDAIRYAGRLFRLWLSRDVEGVIKEGSFTQDARGRWYVNLQCEVEDATEPVGQAEVGVDLGVKDQIACSDMRDPYSRENLTRQHEDELALAQRAGKKKRIKAIHAKIKNKRKDWAHKVTTAIARRAKRIVVGDVSSTKLAKTKLAKSTYDAAWGIVRHQPSLQRRKGGALQSHQACWRSPASRGMRPRP